MTPCPICSSPKTKLRFKLIFNVHHCSRCGFQFCPDAKFNKSLESDLNEDTRERALLNLRKENFQRIINSLKQNMNTTNIQGLEVGPGYGWFLEVCRDHNIGCEGIEPETRFNERYKQEGLKVFNGFFPQDLPQNAEYDFIAYNDVLEHLPDLRGIMTSNYKLLKNQGLLIVNLPIQSGVIYFISKLVYHFGIKSLMDRMWQFNFHSPHLSYFTKRTLGSFAKECNFEPIESFPMKTINLSEISDRINQDKQQGAVMGMIAKIGIFLLFPFLNLFPDTYCFVFKKSDS